MESNELWRMISPRLTAAVGNGLSVDDVAEFCKTTHDSVKRWLRGSNKPAGDAMIRMWYLLREIDVVSPEINALPPLLRTLGELFAFDVISAGEVLDICGLNSQSISPAYVTMRGQPPMHPQFTVDALIELYGSELGYKRTVVKERIGPVIDEIDDLPVAPPVPINRPTEKYRSKDVPQEVVSVSYGPDPLVTLASLLSAAGPLAKRLVEDGSAEQRSRFRDLIGSENMFNLSNTMNQLCSERARGLAR